MRVTRNAALRPVAECVIGCMMERACTMIRVNLPDEGAAFDAPMPATTIYWWRPAAAFYTRQLPVPRPVAGMSTPIAPVTSPSPPPRLLCWQRGHLDDSRSCLKEPQQSGRVRKVLLSIA
eukprot:351082-Chlamydomonas_euryale.AAC.5